MHWPQNRCNHPTRVLTIRFDGRIPYGSFQSPQDLLDQRIPIRRIKDLFRGSERNTCLRIHGSKRFEDVMRKNGKHHCTTKKCDCRRMCRIICYPALLIHLWMVQIAHESPLSNHVTWPVAKVSIGHVLKDHWNPTSLNSWRS